MGAGKYLLIRAAAALPMLWVLLTVVFVVLRVMPGDPAAAMLGGHAVPAATLEAFRRRLGLDQPLAVQYVQYLLGIARGDLGQSARTGLPVWSELALRLPPTVELAVAALCVAAVAGVISGAIAATAADRSLDHALRGVHIAALAAFIPWIGLMLKLIFSVWLGWLPTGGRIGIFEQLEYRPRTHFVLLDALMLGDWTLALDALAHLILPAITLGFVLSGTLGRMSRASVLETLSHDYIRTARAKGLGGGRVVAAHALPNALMPIVTVFGLQFAMLLGGAVLTEWTFNWPGIGRYLLESIQARDFPAIQGCVVLIAGMVSLVSLAVDLIYSWLDPRVRY
ncbi:MAG TPA: ABC transporter permease [Limnochordia bacterium]